MFGFIESIDIIELFYAFFGAFGGFLLAFQWEKHSSKKKKKKAIENIALELFGIRMTLDTNIISNAKDSISLDENCYKRILYIRFSIITPVWDALIYSGVLLDFKDELYFDELIMAYTRVTMIRNQLISVPNGVKNYSLSDYNNCVKMCIVTIKSIDKFFSLIDFPLEETIADYIADKKEEE